MNTANYPENIFEWDSTTLLPRYVVRGPFQGSYSVTIAWGKGFKSTKHLPTLADALEYRALKVIEYLGQ